ncbi:hypothetical protein Fmac_030499 [Flemingia macrophylla]|uniref:Uncharacterized protein n=1 Tax=Flemingia macrophylla TaxID=520843 RepID=A0ABD1KZV5_9FABA
MSLQTKHPHGQMVLQMKQFNAAQYRTAMPWVSVTVSGQRINNEILIDKIRIH